MITSPLLIPWAHKRWGWPSLTTHSTPIKAMSDPKAPPAVRGWPNTPTQMAKTSKGDMVRMMPMWVAVVKLAAK